MLIIKPRSSSSVLNRIDTTRSSAKLLPPFDERNRSRLGDQLQCTLSCILCSIITGRSAIEFCHKLCSEWHQGGLSPPSSITNWVSFDTLPTPTVHEVVKARVFFGSKLFAYLISSCLICSWKLSSYYNPALDSSPVKIKCHTKKTNYLNKVLGSCIQDRKIMKRNKQHYLVFLTTNVVLVLNTPACIGVSSSCKLFCFNFKELGILQTELVFQNEMGI